MSDKNFQALMVHRENGAVEAKLEELKLSDLPPGDVLVKVAYSSLNYKDGLAVTGKGKIIRQYPFVPGIDLAGIVEESHSPRYQPGDQVIVTGWGIGENHWGGYAQYARVNSDWLVPLPEGLSLKQAMTIGTAGFTAMLCVMALEKHGLTPKHQEVIVTGAAGGVGSFAVALLSQLGYQVTASTGRKETHDYLRELGAKEIIDRETLLTPSKPLETQRWAGAIDTVGGKTLGNLLSRMSYNSYVAACGLAGGSELVTTVFPFILRGVALIGVESVVTPYPIRLEAWKRLSQEFPSHLFDHIAQIISLSEVPKMSNEILKGQVRGRVVVDVNA